MGMKILELFSGTESFSRVARERGHETFTIDNDPQFNPDLCKDINDVTIDDIPFKPDIIWASPPCQKFSVASISRHWENKKPKHSGTYESLLIVAKTISLILSLKPKFWIIENPRGMLRKQPMMINLNKNTITYCQYGSKVQKPTDLWNNLDNWKPKPMCKPGSNCHEPASRGARKGVQGINNSFSNLGSAGKVLRSIVPEELCLEIIKCCELSLSNN